jgi:hypothetical protein
MWVPSVEFRIAAMNAFGLMYRSADGSRIPGPDARRHRFKHYRPWSAVRL